MSYEIFKRLCQEKNVTATEVARATGVSKGTFSHWKNGDYQPKTEKRRKIAEYFGVTLDYLDTGIVGNVTQLTDEDRDLLQIIHDDPKLNALLHIGHNLSDDDFNAVKDYAERLRRSYKD